MRLLVRYAGQYTDHYGILDGLDFDVVLIDPCIAADLTIDPSILPVLPSYNIDYSVFEKTRAEVLTQQGVSSTEMTT